MTMQKIGTENMADPLAAHLHKDMVTLREDLTAADALAQLRRTNLGEKIAYLYVLDSDDRLIGVLPVRRLLAGEPGTTIKAIMLSPVVSVPASSSVLDACEVLLNRRLLALPVVDSANKLQGVIDLSQFTDEVLTSTRRQRENAFQLIGVHVAWGRRVSAWRSFRERFPWLMCNMTSGIICALIASRFELLLSQFVLLAMFLTVVLALGESVSMQSMTITLQGLLGRQTGWRQILVSARKEFITSALLAMACGSIIGLTALLWRGHLLPALAVAGGIALSVITGCLLGVAIPTAIHKLKIDPKVAAGPIVLASTDIATLIFYFSMARWLLTTVP
ncbi:MAG: magnesium transporter [Phycisphaerae bacterium]|nr:magnesium transporter [Phycisphaerae bacterium]